MCTRVSSFENGDCRENRSSGKSVVVWSPIIKPFLFSQWFKINFIVKEKNCLALLFKQIHCRQNFDLSLKRIFIKLKNIRNELEILFNSFFNSFRNPFFYRIKLNWKSIQNFIIIWNIFDLKICLKISLSWLSIQKWKVWFLRNRLIWFLARLSRA